MTDISGPEYPDEVLFFDDLGTDVTDDGKTQLQQLRVHFGDGNRLLIVAEAPLVAEKELTPEQISTYDLETGETSTRWDATLEQMRLFKSSTAYRVLKRLENVLHELPEREKEFCPRCGGYIECDYCDGAGCVECNQTGICQECDGRGFILKPPEH